MKIQDQKNTNGEKKGRVRKTNREKRVKNKGKNKNIETNQHRDQRDGGTVTEEDESHPKMTNGRTRQRISKTKRREKNYNREKRVSVMERHLVTLTCSHSKIRSMFYVNVKYLSRYCANTKKQLTLNLT